MAQYRQTGVVKSSDHVSIAVRGVTRHRRSNARSKISIVFYFLTLTLVLSFSAFFYFSLPTKGVELNRRQAQEIDVGGNYTDLLQSVARIENSEELKFGQGSIVHGRDSRDWDKDDRRRDGDYSEVELERTRHDSVDKLHSPVENKSSSFEKSHIPLVHRVNGLYNEAGRNELKMYEAEYEASLKTTRDSVKVHSNRQQRLNDADGYDDGIDLQDDHTEEYDDVGHDDTYQTGATEPRNIDTEESSHAQHVKRNKPKINEDADKAYTDEVLMTSSDVSRSVRKINPGRRSHSKRKPKRRKVSGFCEMKFANSTLLVEPLESRKFAKFSLKYTESEVKPIEDENWEPRFSGHQSLTKREESFIAQDQKINCGFVKGSNGSSSTGFDMAEDDAKYISSCHIAVMSCIFGNSDRLRSPFRKTISRLSRKNVCFVMFVDELTIRTLSSEGQMPDSTGFVGFWKIVVVKNLPYTDMRRVGKIPKLLPHRLFPKARYSIWLDSKLRLQLDPLLILENFLWRKGHEYAISNHYDRHCLWEEVLQNKKLHKYNQTVIDQQFAFYQADGMNRFNASDPNKLLPSNVPEGSFIVRAHTPMSNLFSCLWFNEVDLFTPRDQLSFAYTYHKLRRMNPEKRFYLNMFKDCERRKITKLYRHRSEEQRNFPEHDKE